jgi:hypothetical protein
MIRNPQAYNAAIALNNAGVLLVQRRMPLEAVATIQDALRLMRYSFFCPNAEEGHEIPIPSAVCDDALQAAWKRTSIPKNPEDQSTHRSLEKRFLIVTDHDSPSIVHDTLRRALNSQFVIKIDPLEGLIECEDMMDRLEIESSIMLYNYAIASNCFAEGQADSADDTRLNSMKILKLAQSGVTKLLNDALSFSESPTDISSSLLLVSMLVLNTLFQMCAPGTVCEPSPRTLSCPAQAYADDLAIILTAISEREKVFSQEGNGLTLAAPAA